ncbi:Peroxisomal membrane protein MPV17 [Handroanthus impetiginosus]|uniref:Peroxisomal membrane protein MPV17 n=1 Tax=Handroanthus impetiginosus TaxID=429701 RepID=A0A2G9HCL8_9LAMI|nr:Peroxisomal membrane protein MPV17 [Handroanthus impetiginosus]
MAAAFPKNGLLKTQLDHRSLYHSYKRSLRYTLPGPVSAQNNISNLLQQPRRFSRFTHSIFRKTEFSIPVKTPSRFSTRASSSSQKFGFVNWYLSALKTRPISTKSITAAFIYTAADISSQTIVVENLEQYDLIRILRMAGYGMVILGPSVHYWYNFMSRVFPKRDLLSTFKKMALGQALFGPAMTVIFFSVNAALQGESSSEIVARLKRDLLPTMINGIMYWPVCDFVTFKFIPVHLQPLVTNSFSYIWTVYMTYMASLTKVGAS